METDNNGCAFLGCLAAPFLLLFSLLFYLIVYGGAIALIILVVLTILEWFGVDCPAYRAPSWFGFEGQGD